MFNSLNSNHPPAPPVVVELHHVAEKLAWLTNVSREAAQVLTSHAMTSLDLLSSTLLDTVLSYKLAHLTRACLPFNERLCR